MTTQFLLECLPVLNRKGFEAFSFNFVFSTSDIVHSVFCELTVSNYRFTHTSLSLPY